MHALLGPGRLGGAVSPPGRMRGSPPVQARRRAAHAAGAAGGRGGGRGRGGRARRAAAAQAGRRARRARRRRRRGGRPAPAAAVRPPRVAQHRADLVQAHSAAPATRGRPCQSCAAQAASVRVHAYRPPVLLTTICNDKAGRRRLGNMSFGGTSKDSSVQQLPLRRMLRPSRPTPRPAARPGTRRRWRTRARAPPRRCTASSQPRARAWRPQRPPRRGPARQTRRARTSWRLLVRSIWAAAPQSTSGRAPLRYRPCTLCTILWQCSSLEAAAARCVAGGAAEQRRAQRPGLVLATTLHAWPSPSVAVPASF
jgi:hypothetical protein